VVGCHHGNCKSHAGTDHAAARVRHGLNLGVFGQRPPRLGYRTIASNEAARFQKLLREFAAD
jgi:coenzyme F420-reducing hydrogenase delta subunit